MVHEVRLRRRRSPPTAARSWGTIWTSPTTRPRTGPRSGWWPATRSSPHPATLIAYTDRPAYRAERVAYPLLAAPFRLGGEQALVWGLVVVNLAIVAVGAYVTARLAQRIGAPVQAGYAFALNPLVLAALVLDLADALTVATLVGLVLAVRRQRWGVAVALGVAGRADQGVVAAGRGRGGGGRRARTRGDRGHRAPPDRPGGGPGRGAGRVGRLRPLAHRTPTPPRSRRSPPCPFGGVRRGVAAGLVARAPVGQRLRGRHARRRSPSWWWCAGGAAAASELWAALPFAVLVPFLSGQVVHWSINSHPGHRPGAHAAGAGRGLDRAGRRRGRRATSPPGDRAGRPAT